MAGKKTSDETELLAGGMDGTEEVRIIKGGSNWRAKFSSLASWMQTQISSGTSLLLYKENPVSATLPTATGSNAVAIGNGAVASGSNTHALNDNTTATAYDDTAIGRFNIGGGSATTWVDGDPLFEIGNGTDSSHLANALTVYKNGVVNINGTYSLPNTDGAANQVLTTDGDGNVSWENGSSASSYTVSTTDGTSTPIATFSCTTGQVMKIQVDIAGACTGGADGTTGDGMAVGLDFALRNIDGTVEVIFSTGTIFPDTHFNWGGYTFGIPGGNNVTVNVIGAVSTNIDWKLVTRQQTVVS